MIFDVIEGDDNGLVLGQPDGLPGNLIVIHMGKTIAHLSREQATHLRRAVDRFLNTSDLERGADADMVQF